MAELIGNVVLLVIATIAFKSLVGKNNTAAEKARNALQSIDHSLESQAKNKYKRDNRKMWKKRVKKSKQKKNSNILRILVIHYGLIQHVLVLEVVCFG